MKRPFTSRSTFSLVLLLIIGSALVSGVKESVREVQDAAFFPVIALSIILAYILGFGTWSARRALPIILVIGFIVAFIESARLMEPIKNFLHSIPALELEFIRWLLEYIRWLFEKGTPAVLPDTSTLQIQFNEIVRKASAFTTSLLSASVKLPTVREFFWDMPLLLLATWAGWGTSRYSQPLLALAPMIGLHAFILNYTGKDAFSLQIAIFSVVLITGINQKWNLSQEKTGSSEEAARETYPVIVLLSIFLAFVAGITPSFSIKDVTQKLTRKDELAGAIGLEKEIAQIYLTGSGLPRQHLVGLSPRISNTVIFTVKTGELVPTENIIIKEAVPRHYWRWLTYDIYTGHGWSTSPTKVDPYTANQLLLPISGDRYQIIHQQVEKSFSQDNRLYWTGSLISADQAFNANWRISPESPSASIDPLLRADMLGATIDRQSYQAESLIPLISAEQLRASETIYPNDISARYLALPNTVPQRVLDLAKQLTANTENPYDKAKAIETYLRTYPYSLEIAPPPKDQDITDYFLFDLKIGYCDYYATSMVVLARAAGLPARLVIGYANGIYDSAQAEYIVREMNAHSWVEVYFTGFGWMEFEPTASEPSINLPNDLPRDEFPSLTPFPPLREHQRHVKAGRFPHRDIGDPALMMIGLTGIIFISGIWFLSTQGLLRTHRSIGSIYEHVYYHGKKIYRDAPLYETPSIFADKLQSRMRTGYPFLIPAPEEIKLLTRLYLQETYTAHPITKDERMQALKIWRKLFWRFLYARMVVRL